MRFLSAPRQHAHGCARVRSVCLPMYATVQARAAVGGAVGMELIYHKRGGMARGRISPPPPQRSRGKGQPGEEHGQAVAADGDIIRQLRQYSHVGRGQRSRRARAQGAVMDFTLSAEQQMIRDMCREFAEAEIKPRAEEMDRSAAFPYDLIHKMA